MAAKFQVGDRVRLQYRIPDMLYALGYSQYKRTRTIIRIEYDPYMRCCFYYLGFNNKGNSNKFSTIAFRSYQLAKAKNIHKVGRPRSKRKWNRKHKDAIVL